jgi:hypothetical protein
MEHNTDDNGTSLKNFASYYDSYRSTYTQEGNNNQEELSKLIRVR